MKKVLTAVSLMLLGSLPLAADPQADFDSEYGFTMNAPAVDNPDQAGGQVCIFFLPAEDGFAANVNVIKQVYDGTLQEYDELSLGQLKQMGYTIIQHTLEEHSAVYEYVGSYQGKRLHWYATATKMPDAVLLATAVTLRDSWKEQGPALVASLKSIQLKK